MISRLHAVVISTLVMMAYIWEGGSGFPQALGRDDGVYMGGSSGFPQALGRDGTDEMRCMNAGACDLHVLYITLISINCMTCLVIYPSPTCTDVEVGDIPFAFS